jgi:PhzF family phenazine biosynthesis protein
MQHQTLGQNTMLTQYQVDAFTNTLFKGNPAAVMPLQQWLDDDIMLAIAAENNLSETAFFVVQHDHVALRWFTPVAEVDLCGHATLAAAYVLFEQLAYHHPVINFETRSGRLTVRKQAQGYAMDFPTCKPIVCAIPPALMAGLGREPVAVLAGDDYLVVFESEADIASLSPDFAALQDLDLRGVIVTAPSTHVDFVSRFFAPKLGVNEDPVTGSAHCQLAPYWAERLGKTSLKAQQSSKRGGNIGCEMIGDRVVLTGQAVLFMTATILLDH